MLFLKKSVRTEPVQRTEIPLIKPDQLAQVAGGGFILAESVKPNGFILAESVRPSGFILAESVRPNGFILSE